MSGVLRQCLSGSLVRCLSVRLVLVGVLVVLLLPSVAQSRAANTSPPLHGSNGTVERPSFDHASARFQREPLVRVDMWRLDTVVDWQSGFVDSVLISNNEGGELRLVAGQQEGSFLTRPFSATFAFNAAGAFWRADTPPGTDLVLEIRGRTTAPDFYLESYEEASTEAGWGPWQQIIAGDARSQADDGALATPDVLAFPPETRYLQVRASFRSSVPRASAVLKVLNIAYLNAMQGPAGPAGLPQAPIIFGPDVLTPRPMHILRSTWSGQRLAAEPTYATPRGIIIHQIEVLSDTRSILPLLRAQATYQKTVLGWDDLTYHYLIDQSGNLYEGRMGGPTSYVSRLSGGDKAIHIALPGHRNTEPGDVVINTLINLLAWLSQAYHIPATDHHLVGEAYETRQNIVGHQQAVPEAPDPGQPLLDMLPTIRDSADRSIIRSRWFFPEGNVRDYIQRLIFFNPNSDETDAIVSLHTGTGTPVELGLTLPANGHTSLLVNDVVTGTDGLSAVVAANEEIIVERSMETTTDLSVSPGIPKLSRVWYFAEASTDETFNTYLVLFNPHNTFTEAVVTYMRGDGKQARQEVYVPPQERVVVTVNDVLPGYGFGMKIVADRPIAAERTMRFGPGGVGVHIGPGSINLSRSWYFAEGTTDPPFTMRLLVLNPNEKSSKTTITFMTPDGTTLRRNYVIPPTTRLVVDVNEVVPTLGVATSIESEWPLVAERALYFDPNEFGKPPVIASRSITTSLVLSTTDVLVPEDTIPLAGTVSFGARQPAYVWHFAYGRSRGAREYLLLSNPSRRQARVAIEFVREDGSHDTQHIVMPANSRYTLAAHDFYPEEEIFSTIVRSTQPVVAERSLFATEGATGGTTSPGIPGE